MGLFLAAYFFELLLEIIRNSVYNNMREKGKGRRYKMLLYYILGVISFLIMFLTYNRDRTERYFITLQNLLVSIIFGIVGVPLISILIIMGFLDICSEIIIWEKEDR